MNLKHLLAGMFCAIAVSASAQDLSVKRKTEYTKLSIGIPSIQFRDFATSPLVYSGAGIHGDFGSYNERGTSITTYGAHVSFGATSDPYSSAISSVTAVNIYYGKLLKVVPGFRHATLHLGGLIEGTTNVRVNGNLMNNSFGLELAPAVYASGKITRDISRKEARTIKPISFIPGIQLQPRERNLSFQLNVGLLNGAYRNGYAYAGQTAVLNNFSIFEDYNYTATAGARFSGELMWTEVLDNGNRIGYSYFFQQYALNGFDRFEWMQQGVKLTIYFQPKSKAL